ncbi:MAG TPA: PQQ-binding-like beta-propeller repeat protein [Tepidisphaeraceae bacterium]|nr:PQQ-binding-like beta-propeller repeat protein [Tepidisphaeraceae bacterium]
MTRSICILICVLAVAEARAADWPNWRGPDHNGISSESNWLDHWPAAGPAVAWKANVGTGFSSFCVAGGRVYTAGNADNSDTVYCFDADTGKLLWKYSYPADLGDKYFEGGPAATAAVEEGRAYFSSRWGDVFCLDAATGKLIWSVNIPKETDCRTPEWGFGGSPLLFKNLVVLNIGEAGTALDKSTGKIAWTSGKKEAGYSTPVPVHFDGQSLGLFANAASYLAVNLETGKALWRVRWLTQGGINIADPLVKGDKVMISSGYGKGAELLKMGSADPTLVWKNREFSTHISPGVLLGKELYCDSGQASTGGPLICVDFDTGEKKWEYPNVGTGGLMIAGDKLIAMTEHGEIMVGPASPSGFTPTARAQVLSGKTWTPPVLANGCIYVRNAAGDVVCLDVRKR